MPPGQKDERFMPDNDISSSNINDAPSQVIINQNTQTDNTSEKTNDYIVVNTKRGDLNVSTKHLNMSFLDLLSNLMSWIFVPLLTPVYGILFIFNYSLLQFTTTPKTRLIVTAVIFGLNVILPIIIFGILKWRGIVSDIGLNRRRERTLPYIIVMLCYLASAYYLIVHSAPMWVAMFFTGGALAALVNFIVNFRWKISAHAAGMAGVVAILIRVAHEMPNNSTTIWLCIWILLTGLLGASRIWLRRHTMPQVMAGFANGFICVWILSMLN